VSDTRPICAACGQYLPLPAPELDRLDAATVFKAAMGQRHPISHRASDRLSPSQMSAIRAIARVHNLDASSECKQLAGCEPEDLTMFAASKFISYLIRIAKERREVAE
jgi:hypothetical protein